MKEYLIPFLAYLSIIPLINSFFDKQIAYSVHVVVAIILITFFWRKYELKFKIDLLAVITGIIIFLLWLCCENIFPVLYQIEYVPSNGLFLIAKLIGFILIAPIIEELFTRGFLIRAIISKSWKKVPIGKYTPASFIITVLFFGFAHNRLLAGIITGIILNLLLYKQKKVESCIIAHFIANLCLAIYIISTSSWMLW